MPVKLVCLGDSLTCGYEARRPVVWTALAARECDLTWFIKDFSE